MLIRNGLSEFRLLAKAVFTFLFVTLAVLSSAQVNFTSNQTISTNQNYTGPVSIITGTVTVSSGTTTINGNLSIGTGGLLVIKNGAKVIVNGTTIIGTSNTGTMVVENGGQLIVTPSNSAGTTAIAINSTSATALDIQTGGSVVVNRATPATNAALGMVLNTSSKANVAGSLQIRGGGLSMNGSSRLTYSGSGNDTIIGDPNATGAYFSNTTVLTVGAGVNLYIKGDVKNDSQAEFAINGNVSINGNYQSGNNTANVTGTGTLNTTGSLDADSNQGSVFGERYSCGTGPCSGNNLISSTNTSTCNGSAVNITGVAVSGATYVWLVSTTSATAGFTAISGATAQNYSTTGSSTTQYTYYKRHYTLSGKTYNSNTLTITSSYWMTPTAVPAIGGANSVCQGSTITLTNSLGGGTWSSASPAVATVNASSGVVTGISGGTSVITYAGPSWGCFTPATKTITVIGTPLVTIVNTSGTYIMPTGAKAVLIQTWGAGGGGSKGYSNLKGTGGGGGGFSQKNIAATAGDVITYSIGAAGTGATVYGNGQDGGTTIATLNSTVVSASGGSGAQSVTAPDGFGGIGGVGLGDFNLSGGTGTNLVAPTSASPGGGGGSSAGTALNGNTGSGASGGSAVAGGGAGGDGNTTASGNGATGGLPGGGGGGNSGSGNGGNGAAGQVSITVYYTKISYSSPKLCKALSAAVVTIDGVTGGTFASTSGLSINPATGTINPSTSTAGNYVVTYSTSCGVISSTVVSIVAAPTASAGGSQSLCPAGIATVSGANANNGTIMWTENGAGSLTGANTLTPSYTPGAADIGTTVTLTITVSNGTCTNATATYSVFVSPCIITWTGNTSTAWTTATNWSSNTIPTPQHTVVIPTVVSPKFYPQIGLGVVANAAAVTVNSGASLTINHGGILNNNGNLTNNGTFTTMPGSLVVFKGTSSQGMTGVSTLHNATLNNTAGLSVSSALSIKGTLLLTAGTLTTNGNVQVDIDNGGNIGFTTGDAGSVIGNLKVFRAINTNTTHYISCPLDGVAGHDLADDAEVINPTNGNTRLFHYDNTAHSWIADKDMGAVFVPGNAYSMWFPVATTVDFTGSYNHSASYTYSGTNTANKYLFISNPYPSTIDWTAAGWSKSNVKDAIYFWNPNGNQYASYINGVGTNGGSKNIPAMNSFFVAYSATGGSSATVSMTNSVRVTQSAALWRTASDETVRLTLRSATATDETVIRFNEHATNGFDDNFDAYKMMNSGSVPSIYTTSGTDRYSINSIADMYSKDTIPVMIKVPADGEYVLSIDVSDPSVAYMLADKKLGTATPLTTSDYAFTALKADDAARFELQVRSHVTTGVEQASALTSMHILSSPGGFLIRSGLSGSSTVEVLDMTGNRVQVMSGVVLKTGDNFFTPVVSAGVYVVKVTVDNMSYVAQVSIVK